MIVLVSYEDRNDVVRRWRRTAACGGYEDTTGNTMLSDSLFKNYPSPSVLNG